MPHAKTRECLSLTIPSEFAQIEAVEEQLRNIMHVFEYDTGPIDGVSTAFREAMSNAIRWGNEYAYGRPVEITLIIDRYETDLRIRDQGTNPIDFSRATQDFEQHPLELLGAVSERYETERRGGIGIGFMKAYMSEVNFADIRDAQNKKIGTEVRMVYRNPKFISSR